MTDIVVPQLGESVVEARVAKWLKKEGDHVRAGEALVELETEKIDLEVNAEKSGVVTSIKRHEGEDVKIGEILAVLDETAADPKPAAGGNGSGAKAKTAAVAAAASDKEEPRATPTAKRMAKDHDVDLGTVQGSGAAGRVMKQDVKNAMAPPAAPAARAEAAPQARPAAPAPPARAGERSERRVRM